jgi:hypothetical protein
MRPAIVTEVNRGHLTSSIKEYPPGLCSLYLQHSFCLLWASRAHIRLYFVQSRLEVLCTSTIPQGQIGLARESHRQFDVGNVSIYLVSLSHLLEPVLTAASFYCPNLGLRRGLAVHVTNLQDLSVRQIHDILINIALRHLGHWLPSWLAHF